MEKLIVLGLTLGLCCLVLHREGLMPPRGGGRSFVFFLLLLAVGGRCFLMDRVSTAAEDAAREAVTYFRQAGGFWGEVLKCLSSSNWCRINTPKYSIGLVIYIVLVIFFAYFYTSITFNPLEVSDNMKKSGGFIPGIRPGKPTSDYLTKILNYIIFIGACGLTLIGVLPFVFNGLFGASVSFGGTSLIIIVSVVLETIKQIESQMLVRNYKGFLND